MSQSRKKRADGGPVEKAPSSKATDREHRARRTGFVIASVVIILILFIVGAFYYQEYVAPFRRPGVKVDDTSISMGYFLKKAQLTGAGPTVMLTALTNEQLVKLEAPRYGIKVSPEDVEQELRRIARGESETISESEFKAWYRQQLNETRLSDSEYREITATSLLTARLHEYLAERVPTVAEQIHLHAILVEKYEDAAKVRARWEAGEDFAALAREVSLDEQSKEKAGDLGWLPSGIMGSGFDDVAFNLSTGNVSEPLPLIDKSKSPPTIVGYYLLMVSEKAEARELDEESLQALKDRALEQWLLEEIKFHKITYHGFNNGFDSETAAWISWQLSKNTPSTQQGQQGGQ